MNKLSIILFFLLFPIFVFSQTIMSWNIQNLGEAKFKRDTIVPQIASVMKTSGADIISIQEIVTSKYGDSCVIQLSKLLNYNYYISSATKGRGSKRYSFLFRKDIKLNWARLDRDLEDFINREPLIGSFNYRGKEIILRQVHLVPTVKNPKKEIVYLYKYRDGIICGDFNLSCNDSIYIPLLTFFNTSSFCEKGTSLKRDGTVSNNNYSHFFVGKEHQIKETKIYLYDYRWNKNLLSDHLPIILILK